MMPTIRIDDEVWRYLQEKATPFEDSPNDVLRRELGLEKAIGSPETNPEPDNSERQRVRPPDRDYSHQSVRGYRLEGGYVPCRSFKEVLVGLSNQLRARDQASFDRVALGLHGTKRVYFSQDPAKLKFPQPLTGHGLFVETNLNANLIVGICFALLRELGVRGHFEIDAA
jgi:negative regulator of replication initiation